MNFLVELGRSHIVPSYKVDQSVKYHFIFFLSVIALLISHSIGASEKNSMCYGSLSMINLLGIQSMGIN